MSRKALTNFAVGFAAALALICLVYLTVLIVTQDRHPARPMDDGFQSFVPNPTEEDRRMGREALAFYEESRHADPKLRP